MGCFVVVVCLKDATDPKSKKRGRWGGERKIDTPIKMHEIQSLR